MATAIEHPQSACHWVVILGDVEDLRTEEAADCLGIYPG
jgi:hypothetical protein